MNKLFLQDNSTLNTLQEGEFNGEPELQELLEHYPELIPSDEIIGNPSFFLIQREFPVSTGSVDHLFIDQEMVPTIVETKVNNPEIRRKIIGQGFEYLTSLSFDVTGKQIVEYAKRYWKDQYSAELQKRLGLSDLDAKNVEKLDKNLKKPRLRLIFAADFIPRELRKFVEFINNASRGIDVYAIQIERYILDAKKIISVSSWGPTENSIHDKAMSFGILSRPEFINKINQSQNFTPSEKELFINRVNEILDIAEEIGLSVGWGTKTFKLSFHKINKIFEQEYNGNSYIAFIKVAKRDEFITKIYEQLDGLFDVQKVYRNKPDAQFKKGSRSLYQLSADQYKRLLDILVSFEKG